MDNKIINNKIIASLICNNEAGVYSNEGDFINDIFVKYVDMDLSDKIKFYIEQKAAEEYPFLTPPDDSVYREYNFRKYDEREAYQKGFEDALSSVINIHIENPYLLKTD